MEQEKNINKMGTIPVQRLMLSMGVPMIFSMMLQAFYNIVDSAFVSNMAQHGEAALTALTLAFPVQMFWLPSALAPASAPMPCYPAPWEKEIVKKSTASPEMPSFSRWSSVWFPLHSVLRACVPMCSLRATIRSSSTWQSLICASAAASPSAWSFFPALKSCCRQPESLFFPPLRRSPVL